MAGRGTRLRPHTLTTPKPLLKIAGKPIVQWLVEDLAARTEEKFEDIAFVIGDFGPEVEAELLEIASKVGAKGHIFYQEQALGTAHAIYCAAQIMDGHVMVAFADTLFVADFKIDRTRESIIWVKKVDDPSAFGVVKLNSAGMVAEFVEKPDTFVSDLAIIGIYYFRDGAALREELKYLLDNDIRNGAEYQLTTALENMKNKGVVFQTAAVQEWLDCGNKNVLIQTHNRYIELVSNQKLIADSASIHESVIIGPVFIGKNVQISRSVIGPNVSIGDNSKIENAVVKSSIIQEHTRISNALLNNSMIGNYVEYRGSIQQLSLGDYNSLAE